MTKNCSSRAQGFFLHFLVALSFLCPVDALAQPIRSGVVLVPVDVRVVDKRGNPVTDLTITDFEVYEDGVRQQIAHFLTQSFAPASDDRRATAPKTQDASDDFLVAATPRRTFLLLLGRGRLNYPAKGLDGLIDFVKNRVQPTDYVSVVAYLRASEPSADHTALVRFLERYRERHEDIEGRIKADFARTMPFGSPPHCRLALAPRSMRCSPRKEFRRLLSCPAHQERRPSGIWIGITCAGRWSTREAFEEKSIWWLSPSGRLV
jgi:hypothetical protein